MAVYDAKKLWNKEKMDESNDSMEWETPPEIFDPLNKEFGFTFDVCAADYNKKCEQFFAKEDNALKRKWDGICWMNPPFGYDLKKWVEKAYKESLRGTTVVCLIPAKTSTNWWHDIAMKGEVRFIRGRINFINQSGNRMKHGLPMSMAIVIFRPPLKIYYQLDLAI